MASDLDCTTPPTAGQSSGDEWTTLATCTAQGAVDCWLTHLVARQVHGGVALDVFGETVLGEIPRDWYDEDGNVLPMFRTDDGDIRLPEVFNGSSVTGHDGEYILGEMKPAADGSEKILASLRLDDLYDALEQLGWDVDDLEDVRDALEPLFGVADVEVSNHGSLVLFRPRTPGARVWLMENVNRSAHWSGPQLVVEHRFARALIEGLDAEGFRTSP